MNSIDSLLNIKNKKIKIISSNIESLDSKIDGFPMGKLTEIVGKSSIGKTKMLFDIMEFNEDKIIAYISTKSDSIKILNDRDINFENIIICNSNDEEVILSFIKSIVKYVDMIMIDCIPNIVTRNEKKNFDMDEYQNLPFLLSEIKSLIYGEDIAVLLVNHYVNKSGVLVPRWNNKFEQYCYLRLEIIYYDKSYTELNIISNKNKNGGYRYDL